MQNPGVVKSLCLSFADSSFCNLPSFSSPKIQPDILSSGPFVDMILTSIRGAPSIVVELAARQNTMIDPTEKHPCGKMPDGIKGCLSDS